MSREGELYKSDVDDYVRAASDKPQVEASEEDASAILKSERNIANRIRAKFRGDPLGHTTQEQKRHWQLANDEPVQMIEEYVQKRLAAFESKVKP